jgi:LPS-assembly protein
MQLNGRERTLVQRLRKLAPSDPQERFIRAQLFDTGFQRLHSNHSFSMPLNYSDWLSLTPRAGAAYTHYSAVLGPSDSDARSILHGGLESAVKISKDYSDYRNSKLGVDGLLHVVQPYMNWSTLSADELSNDYPSIDHLTFNTRPNPLNPSQYTAIDDLQSWNIMRFGTRHHLITHRDGQSHEWLYMDTYIDKYLSHFQEDVQWSNLYNDIRWQPIPWIGFDLETQTPVINSGSGFSEITTGVTFMPDKDKQISLQYRQLSDHPVLIDSDRIALNTYMRLAENWGMGSAHIFEMDDGVIEMQQLSLHRDFGNWVFAVGLTRRDNRFDQELGLILSITLKDFPSATLPFQIDSQ